jgi:hypothetical protein
VKDCVEGVYLLEHVRPGYCASRVKGTSSFELAETALGATVPASSNGTFPPGALFGRLRATD